MELLQKMMARDIMRKMVIEKVVPLIEEQLLSVGLAPSSVFKSYAIRKLEKRLGVAAVPHQSGGWFLDASESHGFSCYNAPVGKRGDNPFGIPVEEHCEFDAQCKGDESFEVYVRAEGDIRGYQTLAEVLALIDEIEKASSSNSSLNC